MLLATLTTAAGAAQAGSREAAAPLQIKVLSNRADVLSGGDALIEIEPRREAGRGLDVTVDGRDVSAAFDRRPALGGRLVGLLTGLHDGPSRLVAKVPGARPAEILLTNHRLGGPVFAGRQIQPWFCKTTELGLGKALDKQCNTPAVFTYHYKSSTTGQIATYDPTNPPSDVATTTTDQGVTLPFIVRKERGVIDRGVYDIALLFHPKKPWSAVAPQSGWNHKLLVKTGSGCEAGHTQVAPGSVLDSAALGRGFAVLMNAMVDNTQNCNDVVQAEALMMTKEHLVEAYGTVRYTIADGCSGGSMAQHSIAANYPGLLDGIQPACSFPDIQTTYQEMADCKILSHYFDSVSPYLWTEPQRAWASGHASAGTCEFQSQLRSNSYVSASGGSACKGTPWVYDANTNPKGARCGIQDYEVAIFGRRPSDGFANRAYDNVGVQYGLAALEAGQILPEQFVDFNEKVGGLDIDGNTAPKRSVADPPAIATAYRSGRITNGRELARIPIIDLRGSSNFEEHFDWHTYEFRNRLLRDNGTAANMISWRAPCCLLTYSAVSPQAFDLMDRWLAAIEKDTSDRPQAVKVLRHKPADAVDACFVGTAEVTDEQVCDAALPHNSETRRVAGGPDTADVIKCRLEPRRRNAYFSGGQSVAFTNDQWSRLQKAFPNGVCDYSRPGVAQQAPDGPWMSFSAGPGGRPLGAPPTSRLLERSRR